MTRMRRFEFIEGKSSKFWEIEVVEATIELRWGRIGTAGQSKGKPFDTSAQALAEAEKLVAKKLKEGYRETTAERTPADGGKSSKEETGAPRTGDAAPAVPAADPSASPGARQTPAAEGNPEVVAILDKLRAAGARVDTRPGTTTLEDVRRAETKLGFSLPEELREFFVQFGHVKIELERTWNFYGISEAVERAERYRGDFERSRQAMAGAGSSEDDGGYFPRRFVVLVDEGDYANAATGTVYDADLGGLLVTDGHRGVGRDEAIDTGYWGYLLDELDEIVDRITDPDDVLVAGGSRDVARRQQARDGGAQASPLGRWKDAIARLYRVFDKYPFPERARHCFMGEGCKDCRRSNTALASKPLRSIGHEELFHFAYYPRVATKGEQEDFKHALPRILELLDEIGWQGNPSVVIGQILKKVREAGLTSEEDRAVEDALLRRWENLLGNAATDVSQLRKFLDPIAVQRDDVAPYLEAWSALLGDKIPLELAVACESAYDFRRSGEYYGLPEPAFEKLRAWFAVQAPGAVLAGERPPGEVRTLRASVAEVEAPPTPDARAAAQELAAAGEVHVLLTGDLIDAAVPGGIFLTIEDDAPRLVQSQQRLERLASAGTAYEHHATLKDGRLVFDALSDGASVRGVLEYTTEDDAVDPVQHRFALPAEQYVYWWRSAVRQLLALG